MRRKTKKKKKKKKVSVTAVVSIPTGDVTVAMMMMVTVVLLPVLIHSPPLLPFQHFRHPLHTSSLPFPSNTELLVPALDTLEVHNFAHTAPALPAAGNPEKCKVARVLLLLLLLPFPIALANKATMEEAAAVQMEKVCDPTTAIARVALLRLVELMRREYWW